MSKKSKKQMERIQQIVEFWLPILNETALQADGGVYAHPWVPVEILREIEKVLKEQK